MAVSRYRHYIADAHRGEFLTVLCLCVMLQSSPPAMTASPVPVTHSAATYIPDPLHANATTSRTVRAVPTMVPTTATQSTTTISAGEVPVAASTSRQQDKGVVIAPVTLTELQNITLPTRLVTRERPKGTNKSLNRKYGCKGVPKRKREEMQAVDDSICYICMNDEPDKTKMTGSQITSLR